MIIREFNEKSEKDFLFKRSDFFLHHYLKLLKQMVNSVGNMLTQEYKVFYIEVTCMRYLHIIERKGLEAAYKIVKGRTKYVK